ncbi:hypothetical protein COCOBI_07-0470 [Coccomyxa sp. Obi]|nr:hypothetical protein COCOBI_07-0470 [Coccomyxa sp. Obi]
MLSSLQPSSINVQGIPEATQITQQLCISPMRTTFKRFFKSAGSEDEKPLPETMTLATCNPCSSSEPTSAVRWFVRHCEAATDGQLSLHWPSQQGMCELMQECEGGLPAHRMQVFSGLFEVASDLATPQDESASPRQRRAGYQTGDSPAPFHTPEEFGCWMVAQMTRLVALNLSLSRLPMTAPRCGAGLKHLVLRTNLGCRDASGCHMGQQALSQWWDWLAQLRGLETLVLCGGHQGCCFQVPGCDLSDLPRLTYLRLENMLPAFLALPPACRLDWQLSSIELMLLHGGLHRCFQDGWGAALNSLHTCVLTWHDNLDAIQALQQIFRNPTSVRELHIQTTDQKPMTELDLALPGCQNLNSLVIEAAGDLFVQLPARMQLCRLHVITPGALSLTAEDPAAASERLTDLLVTCGSYRGMSHLGGLRPYLARNGRRIGFAKQAYQFCNGVEAVCSAFVIEGSGVAQTLKLHNVQFPVFVEKFRSNVQGYSDGMLDSPVPF